MHWNEMRSKWDGRALRAIVFCYCSRTYPVCSFGIYISMALWQGGEAQKEAVVSRYFVQVIASMGF